MKNILGFGRTEDYAETGVRTERLRAEEPVRSLVSVRFPNLDCSYTYYNDIFNLREGDIVFVSGKMAGERGAVETVNYRFKINPADYERVIAHPVISMMGTYAPVLDKMVSIDRVTIDPETFRGWIIPPADGGVETPEYVMGEGYAFDLEHFAESPEVDSAVMSRAIDYCSEGRVSYLSVKDNVGTAFVKGTKWYEVNFRYENGWVRDMYCECPYAGFCKHSIAVLITLREILKRIGVFEFTAVDSRLFYDMLISGRQRVTLLPTEDTEDVCSQ